VLLVGDMLLLFAACAVFAMHSQAGAELLVRWTDSGAEVWARADDLRSLYPETVAQWESDQKALPRRKSSLRLLDGREADTQVRMRMHVACVHSCQ
jgi:hypothetical protein